MTSQQELKRSVPVDRPRFRRSTLASTSACPNGHSGVEAAETRESDARERGRCSARDGTVGVAQYVIAYPTGQRGKESMSETLVHLVYSVCLVYLVRLVGFVQPLTPDRPNRPDRPDRQAIKRLRFAS